MPPSTHYRISHAYQHDQNHCRLDISHLQSFLRRAPPAPAAPYQHHANCHYASQKFAQHRRAIQLQPTSSPKSSTPMRHVTHTAGLSDAQHRPTARESMPKPIRQSIRQTIDSTSTTAERG